VRVEVLFVKHWRLVLLVFELALFAIILILPQVDLPDFTFWDGMPPVAVRLRLCSSPLRVAIGVTPRVPLLSQMTKALGEILAMSASSPVDSRLSGLCILIC
jgi:hypothetical protein